MAFVRNIEKKSIIKVIQDNNLNPLDFQRTDADWLFTLEYKQSGMKFTFQLNPQHWSEFTIHGSVNRPKPKSYSKQDAWLTLAAACAIFDKWIKTEILPMIEAENTPDPWLALDLANRFGLELDEDHDESKFSEAEQIQIVERLSKLEEQITASFVLSEQVANNIEKEIKYLSEKVTVLNKRDWQSVAKSVLYEIGIAIAAQVGLDHIPPLFTKIVQAVFSLIVPEPPSLPQ
jgi:hypothetical protein